MSRRSTKLGPYSKADALSKIDRRTADAVYIRRIRADLVNHVGGKPSTTEALIIERISMLAFRLQKLDGKMLTGGDLTQHDINQYLAWHGSMVRSLRELGLKAAPVPTRTALEIAAERDAKKAADAAKRAQDVAQ